MRLVTHHHVTMADADTIVAAFRDIRNRHLKAGQLPASTLVGVTRLVQPELLLEVEVVAAL